MESGKKLNFFKKNNIENENFEKISKNYNNQLFLNNLSSLKESKKYISTKNIRNPKKIKKELILSKIKNDDISKIKKLDLSNCELNTIETDGTFFWEEFENLEEINLSKNFFTNLADFEKIHFIKSLDLSFNSISSVNISNRLPNLKTLNLDNNLIKDINFLTNCKKIKKLSLKNNNISNLYNSILALKECKKLKSIFLKGNPVSFDYFYRYEIILQIKNIKEIDSEKITDIDQELAKKLNKHFYNLNNSKKENNKNIQSEVFLKSDNFASKLRNLAENNKNEKMDNFNIFTREDLTHSVVFDNNNKMRNTCISFKNKVMENFDDKFFLSGNDFNKDENNYEQKKIIEEENKDLKRQLEEMRDKLSLKNEKISKYKNNLKILKIENKTLNIFKDENIGLKKKLEFYNIEKVDENCKSIKCKQNIQSLQNQINIYLDKIIELEEDKNTKKIKIEKNEVFNNEKKGTFKLKKNKKKKDLNLSKISFKEKMKNDKKEKEAFDDAELEKELLKSLSKLSEAKNLIKDLKNQKQPAKFTKKYQIKKSSFKKKLPQIKK